MDIPDACCILSSHLHLISHQESYNMAGLLRYTESAPLGGLLPDNEPIRGISVVVEEDPTHSNAILSQSFHYELRDSSILQSSSKDLNLLAKYKGELENASYWIEAIKGSSSLLIDSSAPFQLNIVLDEQDYNHNSYIGRYLQFKRRAPSKQSKETNISYLSKVDLSQRLEKRDKDLQTLVERVFSVANIKISLDREIRSLEGSRIKPTPMFTKIRDNSDLRPLSLEETLDPHEMYEYLSLLHMNQIPDSRPDEYVKVTSMYKIPDADSLGNFGGDLTVIFAQKVHPSVLEKLLQERNVRSILYQRNTLHGLIYKINEKVYTWSDHEKH